MSSFLNNELSKKTSIFGLRLWVVLGICVGAGIVLFLFFVSLWFFSRRNSNKLKNAQINVISSSRSNSNSKNVNYKLTIPSISKEITEIRVENPVRAALPDPTPVSGGSNSNQRLVVRSQIEEGPIGQQRIHIEIGKGHRISYPDRGGGSSMYGSSEQNGLSGPEVSHLGWGHWYTLRELEESTNGFADENVIGEGGYGKFAQ